MSIGTVKWFDSKKGFGFILNAEGKDVFVHFSSIAGDGFRSLRDGEQVEYEQIEGSKGLSAKDVRRLEVPEEKPAAKGNGNSRSDGNLRADGNTQPGPRLARAERTGDRTPDRAKQPAARA